MTGRELLEQLKHFDGEAPSLLDKELVLTFGNDGNGNADPIAIEGKALVSAGDLRCNGLVGAFESPDLVLLLDDEGKEDNPITCPHLGVYYDHTYYNEDRPQIGKCFCVDHDGPGGGTVGFRFNSTHLAGDHVREWLSQRQDEVMDGGG